MSKSALVTLLVAALCSPAMAQIVRVNFDALPGPDGLLGTPDDVPLVAPSTFAAQTVQLTTEYSALGVVFTPNPGTQDANEVLIATSFTTPPTYTPPNILTASGALAIQGVFTIPVTRVSALIGISGGADTLQIIDAAGQVIASTQGDDAVVTLNSNVNIAGFRIFASVSTTAAIDNLEFGVPVAPPTTYCTAGTTTNGCNASISASGQPSASQATPCTLSVANVEGQKQGLLFYGLDNSGFTPLPWAATSTSFFCVKSPTQRTFPQSSGGTASQCDGAFAVELNNFFNVFPSALGLPFASGEKLYVQSWFRDPPAPRTTNLSNAIELTMQP